MKESDIKRVLTTPTTDDAMDQNITDALLNIDSHTDKSNNYKANARTRYLANNKWLRYRFSKAAVIILALVLIGTGTVLATGLYVRSYTHERKVITKDEYYKETGIDIDDLSLYGEDIIKKSFGAGNKMISPLRDPQGNVYEITDDGKIIMDDGTIIIPLYVPDPDRYEKAKKAGDDAFAEFGLPNLLPTYLYDNYILGESGFTCFESTQDDATHKWLMGEFIMDGYNTEDFLSERIWMSFSSSEISLKNQQSILVSNNWTEDDFIYSTYTTKGGVLCTISELNIESITDTAGHINVDIVFDSDTIGTGHLLIEFIGFKDKMDKVKEILDTLPFKEESIEVQDMD